MELRKRKNNKDPFDNIHCWLIPICEKLTHHKHCRFVGCDEDFIKGGYKYQNRHDFFYKCKICGDVFFTHKIRQDDLEKLKEKYGEINE